MSYARSILLVTFASALGCGGAAAPPPEAATVAEPSGGSAAAAAAAEPEAPPDQKPEKKAEEQAKNDKAGGGKDAPGQAAADSTALSGKLTQKDIQTIVFKNQDLFNDCYTIGAGKGQQFVATVTVKATIGPKGTVNEALIAKSTAKNPKVDKCVADAFKKIQFPAPKDGATSVITFPMEFNGAEQVN